MLILLLAIQDVDILVIRSFTVCLNVIATWYLTTTAVAYTVYMTLSLVYKSFVDITSKILREKVSVCDGSETVKDPICNWYARTLNVLCNDLTDADVLATVEGAGVPFPRGGLPSSSTLKFFDDLRIALRGLWRAISISSSIREST